MSKLGQVIESVEKYNQFVLDQVKRARIFVMLSEVETSLTLFWENITGSSTSLRSAQNDR